MENEIYNKLYKLIKKGEWKEVNKNIKQLEEGFDINMRDEYNNYLLTYATLYNQPETIKLLLERDVKMDIVDSEERSILYIPIKYGNIEILQLLLEANKTNIGISIIDIKDKLYNIPLHYAIVSKDITIIKILLENGSNVNISDLYGYDSLQYAIYTRSYEICELILKYISDINHRCKTGETSIHIACNLELTKIIQLLITYEININLQDYENEYTALHYIVNLNNKQILELLIENNADPNIQDIYGNTPLHYTIIEKNYEILDILLIKYKDDSSLEYKKINYNLWNIDGKIPLHILLEQNTESITQYIDKIIKKSNMSIQDNNGNTCLHLLIMLNIWNKYIDILVNKRLDIISRNNIGKRVIDLIKEDEYDTFINTVSLSYYNRLIQSKGRWKEEWENICSREFDSFDKNNDLTKYFDNTSKKKTCLGIIKNNIIKIINETKNKKICGNNSFPITKNKQCLNISEGKKLAVCTFTGSTLDVLFGLIFLLKKHKGVCSALSTDFIENKNLCDFYRSNGIIINNKCEFLNFEIVWLNQTIYFIDDFINKLKNCILKKVRFIIIPIGIEMKEGNHANYIIYDISNNTVERFEPYGATTPIGLNYNPTLLDNILKKYFIEINPNIIYLTPTDFLPKIGFQLFEIYENKFKRIGDPGGFCALWSIWYVDMRLTYRDINTIPLVKILLKSIKTQQLSIKNMIRNYASNIINIRDKILKNVNMDINDWLNDQYTDLQIDTVLHEIKKQINLII